MTEQAPARVPEPASAPRGSGPRATRRLTLRGWCVLGGGAAIVALSYVFGEPALFLAGVAIALTPVVALVVALVPRPRLRVSRLIEPPHVTLDDTARVTARVENPGALPVSPGRIVEAIDGSLERGVEAMIDGVGARSSVLVTYEVLPEHRGALALGPSVIESVDALGLTRSRHSIASSDELLVYAREHAVSSEISAPERDTARLDPHLAQPHVDDATLREYRRGDTLRRVDWRASARLQALVVRSEERTRDTSATVLLVTLTTDAAAFEEAVEVAASIVADLHARGIAFEFIELGGPAETRTSSLAEAQQRLARVQPERPERFAGDGSLIDEADAVFGVFASDEALTLPLVRQLGRRRATALTLARGDELERAGWRVIRLERASELTRTAPAMAGERS